MDTVQLRPPILSPLVDHDSPTTNDHVVIFKHPAYPDEFDQNILLQLYAWDTIDGALHAGTALLACSLIACNAWDGYLTVRRDGPKLELNDDDLLPSGEYFFHVPEPSDTTASPNISRDYYRYPIYPSFQHWAFPHRRLPLRWRLDDPNSAAVVPPTVSALTAAIISRDKSCIVSKERDYLQCAHLCPRSESDWFHKNGMAKYNASRERSGHTITDDIKNSLAMIPGIHQAFDDRRFTIMPKSGRWTIHFLEKTHDFGRKYHNVPVDLIGLSPEFLLTRFAWSIFPRVKLFMEQGPERAVKVREQNENGLLREVAKTLDNFSFELMGTASRGRSHSPKKRKAADSSAIVEGKRQRMDSQSVLGSDQTFSHTPGCLLKEACTPDLYLNESASSRAYGASRPAPIHPGRWQGGIYDMEDDPEADRISALRRDAIWKGRNKDPALMCCDYDYAEQADALGIVGKPKYGGGHLCLECLGGEYLPTVDDF